MTSALIKLNLEYHASSQSLLYEKVRFDEPVNLRIEDMQVVIPSRSLHRFRERKLAGIYPRQLTQGVSDSYKSKELTQHEYHSTSSCRDLQAMSLYTYT